MDDVMLHERINEVFKQIRPFVIGHGGDIELVKYENRVVFVRLFGACTHCALSVYTIRYGIEEKLKEMLPDLQRVEVV